MRQPTTLEKPIMVNVIAEGEVSTDTQTQHREAFRQLGDDLSALLSKSYEMADEGSHWAVWPPLGALARRGERTGLRGGIRERPRALEEFKSSHDAERAEPLRSRSCAWGWTRPDLGGCVNVSAKRLVGFSEEEIAALAGDAGRTMEDVSI